MKKPVGRKTKLTPEVVAKVCAQIKRGSYAKNACLLAGISQSLYYSWKEQGEADRSATPPRRTKFSEFLEAVEHAEAVAQSILLRQIVQKGGWKGPLEIMKRRWAKDWGDRQTLSSGVEGNPLPTPDSSHAPVHLKIVLASDKDQEIFTDDTATAEGTESIEGQAEKAHMEKIKERVRDLTTPQAQ